MPLVPVTLNAPVCPTPAALNTVRLEPTPVTPKLVVPVPVVVVCSVVPVVPLSVRLSPACSTPAPVAVIAALIALVSRSDTSAPEAVTTPPKLFPRLSSVTLPLVAVMPLVPVTDSTPD